MPKFCQGDRVEYHDISSHRIQWRADGTLGTVQYDTLEGDGSVGVVFDGETEISYALTHNLRKVQETLLSPPDRDNIRQERV